MMTKDTVYICFVAWYAEFSQKLKKLTGHVLHFGDKYVKSLQMEPEILLFFKRLTCPIPTLKMYNI